MKRLLAWLKPHKHRFAMEDLRMVNPDSPGADRVEWPCADCGQLFKAQCGLDIIPKHGTAFRRRNVEVPSE